MDQQLELRLGELKTEYEKGQVRLQLLESELRSLRETMLRISGAIQVLEEIRQPNLMSDGANASVNGRPPETYNFIDKPT